MNLDKSKSYATEVGLKLALERLGLDSGNYVICRNRAGRWTAVFGFSAHGVLPAHHGFMTIN